MHRLRVLSPSQFGVLFAAMAQEHERVAGGWQARWQTLTQLQLTAGAIHATEASTARALAATAPAPAPAAAAAAAAAL